MSSTRSDRPLIEWLLDGSKTISKPLIQPLTSTTFVPPKNLTFNKELYKFFKSSSNHKEKSIKTEPLKMIKVVTDIKEKVKDSLSDEDPPERPITPIDDGEKIKVPLISSNQLGLLKKPSAGTLKILTL